MLGITSVKTPPGVEVPGTVTGLEPSSEGRLVPPPRRHDSGRSHVDVGLWPVMGRVETDTNRSILLVLGRPFLGPEL